MTLQVKYLVGCVEKLIQGSANNEPYGVPGPSRPSQVSSGSQEEPIIISDDDTTIKMEIDPDVTDTVTSKKVGGKKSKESISRKGFKGAGDKKKSTKKIVSKAKGKAAVRPSDSPSSSDSDGSSSSSCLSSSDGLNSSNRSSFYLKKSDMPKDLREALRVNISKSIYYKLIY